MNQENLRKVVDVLRATLDPKTTNENRRQALHVLETFQTDPNFMRYLCWIFTTGQKAQIHVTIRRSAGIYLKNCIGKAMRDIPGDLLEEIKGNVLKCTGSPLKAVRSTAGTIVSSIVRNGGLKSWSGLLAVVVPRLKSTDANECFGAFDIMRKLCEDVPEQLDSDDVGRPLNQIVPFLLQLLKHSDARVRSLSLRCLNHLIPAMPVAMDTNFQSLLTGVCGLGGDKSADVRKRVCECVNLLMEVRTELLVQVMPRLMEFMLARTGDEDDKVRLEATEFWSSCCMCQDESVRALLGKLLPRLVPTLLSGVVYAADDDELCGFDETDSVPDGPEDLEPHFFQGKSRGGSANAQTDEDADDDASYRDVEGTWTIRKCSGQALDDLSLVFRRELLPVLLPQLHAKWTDPNWRIRESAILAIGAVSSGCLVALQNDLPKLFPFLLQRMADRHPLIRTICAWTLSRFSNWIVASKRANVSERYFDAFLNAVLQNMVIPNKKVQEAACSALSVLVEEAGELVVPHVETILRCFHAAFKRYQKKNQLMLYDVVTSLVDTLGRDGFSREEHVQALTTILVEKLKGVADPKDPMNLPNLECFTSVVRCFALATPIRRVAKALFAKTLQVIQIGLVAAAAEENRDGDFGEIEHIYVGLDLLSAFAEGFGHNMNALLKDSNMRNVLLACLRIPNLSVRQSAIALVGDLAVAAPEYLLPTLPAVFPILIASANPMHPDICNNAAWAVGEITFRILRDPSKSRAVPVSAAHAALARLIDLLTNRDVEDETLMLNAAVAIGRLAYSQATAVASRVSEFGKRWCMVLRYRPDDEEKITALDGMCGVVSASMDVFANDAELLYVLFETVALVGRSEGTIPVALQRKFHAILSRFKAALSSNGQAWSAFRSKFQGASDSRLRAVYGV
eukprot:g2298.t1